MTVNKIVEEMKLKFRSWIESKEPGCRHFEFKNLLDRPRVIMDG